MLVSAFPRTDTQCSIYALLPLMSYETYTASCLLKTSVISLINKFLSSMAFGLFSQAALERFLPLPYRMNIPSRRLSRSAPEVPGSKVPLSNDLIADAYTCTRPHSLDQIIAA